jgi:hypothetical protein
VGLRTLRFASLMLTSVTLTAAFSHLMELPAKMKYEPSLYLRLHRTLYNNYGRVAGIAEILGLLVTSGLAWKLRKASPSAFTPAVTAAAALALSHGIFWIWISPANHTMASWPLDQIPPEWADWRNHWEYAHAVRAVLILGAMAGLSLSVLRGMPETAIERAH